MNDWLSTSQLSKTLEIPESTTRRYLNYFEEFFNYRKIGRGKKYHPNSIELLSKISMLYEGDRETSEIKNLLNDEYPITIETHQNEQIESDLPLYNYPAILQEFKNSQFEFNKMLMSKLEEQQTHINQLISEIKEQNKLNDSFNITNTEREVTRELRLEAITLWYQKPEHTRMLKVGFFKKEENIIKKSMFIDEYIDKHFKERLTIELQRNSKYNKDYELIIRSD